jgi:serine/threonine protein kinase
MLELNGYQILEKIYTSPKRILYRGLRISDGQPVILKCLISEYPTPADIACLQHEYEVTKNLEISGIVKPLELLNVNSRPVLVLDDFGAISLKEYLTNHQLNLREFLYIAIQIAQILGELHQHQLIHNDIKPSNILLNPLTLEVKITDLALASPMEAEETNTILEGTLVYISPEATGRMNRRIDYRTDFYSLGVTFYEMLTGKLPDDTEDTIELIHSHIARIPVAPQVLNSAIPTVLSALVMKLLAKDPGDRYQSAFGIKSDLEHCRNQLEQNGYIDNFLLAERDFYGKLQIPQKLYGRERELTQLFAASERVCAGATQMVLVTGYSGIGKSALVREVEKLRLHGTKISEALPLQSGSQAEPGSEVREYRGYFISGKFDQFQRNIPYSALVQAFSALMRQLLTEEETRLDVWREKLQTALGINGQIIIDAIPEVELLIGSQPPVPNVPPEDAQNRFNLVFQNFIRVFASKEHPLVMFLDDLQWADLASLKLIQLLVTAAKSGLFLIGAYRDNEVNAVHPLKLTVEKNGTVITEIF